MIERREVEGEEKKKRKKKDCVALPAALWHGSEIGYVTRASQYRDA